MSTHNAQGRRSRRNRIDHHTGFAGARTSRTVTRQITDCHAQLIDTIAPALCDGLPRDLNRGGAHVLGCCDVTRLQDIAHSFHANTRRQLRLKNQDIPCRHAAVTHGHGQFGLGHTQCNATLSVRGHGQRNGAGCRGVDHQFCQRGLRQPQCGGAGVCVVLHQHLELLNAFQSTPQRCRQGPLHHPLGIHVAQFERTGGDSLCICTPGLTG